MMNRFLGVKLYSKGFPAMYANQLETIGAKVDLQTQRANTRFDVKACQPI